MNIVTKVVAPTVVGLVIISGFASMAFYGTELIKHLSYFMVGLIAIIASLAAFYGLGNLLARRFSNAGQVWFHPAYLGFGAASVAIAMVIWVTSYNIGQRICGVEAPENGSESTTK